MLSKQRLRVYQHVSSKVSDIRDWRPFVLKVELHFTDSPHLHYSKQISNPVEKTPLFVQLTQH
jgi:hypothetical protein